MHDILIEEKVLAENDRLAEENREFFRQRGVVAINLISSPGAGKTSLIEKTAPYLDRDGLKFAVIEGDLATDIDSGRIGLLGVPVRQITTGKACHLDAHNISHLLPWVDEQKKLKLLVIENVGNMVCPAEYDLGERMKVTVMSVAEGDDKPLKYPAIFAASDVLVINKTDLLPHTDFSMKAARENALSINPSLKVFETSCRTGQGIEAVSRLLCSLAVATGG